MSQNETESGLSQLTGRCHSPGQMTTMMSTDTSTVTSGCKVFEQDDGYFVDGDCGAGRGNARLCFDEECIRIRPPIHPPFLGLPSVRPSSCLPVHRAL